MSMSLSSPNATPNATPSATGAPSSLPAPRGRLLVSTRAAEQLRRGAIFVRRDDVHKPPSGDDDIVALYDERGRALGSALWAARGPIAARLFDRGLRDFDAALLRERLDAAAARRAVLYQSAGHGAGHDAGRDAFRLLHGEADLLPGLFIDRYADAAVVQTTTAAMDARKAEVARILTERGDITRVICRDDGSARDLEELPRQSGVLIDRLGRGTRVQFHDAGSRMEADLLTDRKTGSFLDQQENHAAVGEYAARLFRDGPARGKTTALDCFTYHGGFALALGRAGLKVTACDEAPEAILRARHNATLNGAAAAGVEFVVANAFDLLRQLESRGARFDVVVIDPPALAKRGRNRAAGIKDNAWERAYKELNLRAARLVATGGLLCTCSCSGRVSAADFESIVDAAARDAGRTLQVLERRGAGRDHPALLGWPESEYLKCWLLRVVA
jgi:23S rRNA (cytosine1962-C5)-methyltransferase